MAVLTLALARTVSTSSISFFSFTALAWCRRNCGSSIVSSISSCPSHGQCSCRRRFTGTFAPWETDCSSLYNLLTEHSLQRSIVALARAMRCSQSLQHIDMRRNTVHREGACALLDALDKLWKSVTNYVESTYGPHQSTQRSARRGEIPVFFAKEHSKCAPKCDEDITTYASVAFTPALRNKSNSTHVDTKEAREPPSHLTPSH